MQNRKPFSQTEEEINEFWQKDKTFKKSVDQRDEKDLYVFYDGPPFATGTPHYGHIVAGTIKDVVPRYWAMKGKRVERKWGWDTHGLPIENIVEKDLKLNSREDIEKLGVAKFNEECRSKVMMYADYWKKVVNRLGRWVDMENDYKTMDPEFMESVWWVFKSMHEKDLAYEGYKSMHICPRCETTLSNIEVGQGYKDVKDISVTCKFELEDEPGAYLLAWTTTPWTLPGNVALAVGAEIDYVKVKFENNNYIVAKELLEKVFEGKDFNPVEEIKGKDLENKNYKPLFDFFRDKDLPNKENLYKIVTADFVSTEDGTGVVHLAPAFGEDDMLIGQEKKLSFIQHVALNGRFTKEVEPWAGQEVKPKEDPQKTDIEILKYLASKDLIFAKEKYEHSYPHCWRCDSPLLNYATSSWFFAVTKIKEEMLKNAEPINWVPAHLKQGRFGKWLEGAKDWSISRSRFWGNPMPVWKCENCDEVKVVGGREELEKLSGEKITDLHKHFIDGITFKCEKCEGRMKRIPEVFDCWVESGSMPYGQMHYPFENKEKFEQNFPAEFIAEGVDQTRAWFYVLHVLSAALFNKPAYQNVIVNGTVLAEDGKKMSKSLKNYPDPMEVVNKYGADALRLYLTSSSVMKAEDFRFFEKGVDEVYKKYILILENVLSFYQMFVEEDTSSEPRSENIMDKWILAKTHELIKKVTDQMDAYDLPKSVEPLQAFVHELSNWYVRRSRDRFKNQKSRKEAVSVLKYALEKLALVMAPFTPYMAEHIWRNLGHKQSVHLQDWPRVDEKMIDEKLLSDMETARKLIEFGLATRDENKLKVRQPLARLEYRGVELVPELESLLADELNVKEIVRVDDLNPDFAGKGDDRLQVALDLCLTDELKKEGLLREMIRNVNLLRKSAKLTIEDSADLIYQTESEELNDLLQDPASAKQLKKAALLKEIKQGEGGEPVKINHMEINLKVQK